MGMFDSFYDAKGREWQTKAFGNQLAAWRVGDPISSAPIDHQVAVYGTDGGTQEWADSFATIRGGKVAEVPAERDESLPLLDAYGTWVSS